MAALNPPWRLLSDGPAAPAWNMAVDEALLRHVEAPVLRVYEWAGPAQSIGYFQSHAVGLAGVPLVRRHSGGGLVDHRRDVTYTVVIPRSHPLGQVGTQASYAELHAAVLRALHALGDEALAAAELAPDCQPENDACFQRAVRHDIRLGARKLAGAAQRRNRVGLFHQGSILLPDPARNPALREALAPAFAAHFATELIPGDLTPAERATAADLERAKYATDAWNRQR